MREIVFATNNKHKLYEIKTAVESSINILSLSDINFIGDIPETGDTLKDNAYQKAMFIQEKYKCDCFADDTGLLVDALNGAPGVYSARYAGENPTFEDNMNKLLCELNGIKNRTAVFKTVICLILKGEIHYFEGEVKGNILEEKSGKEGFGYDPIFMPEGYDVSFAEMDIAIKNKISHRGLAVVKLVAFLEKHL